MASLATRGRSHHALKKRQALGCIKHNLSPILSQVPYEWLGGPYIIRWALLETARISCSIFRPIVRIRIGLSWKA